MIQIRRGSLAFLAALVGLTTPAHANGLRAVGAFNLSGWIAKTDTSSLTAGAKPSFGGGVGFDLPLTDRISLDVAGLFLKKKYAYDLAGAEITRTFSSVELPVALRFWVGDTFSIAAGPYAALAIGSVQQSAGGATATLNFSDAALKTLDYGAHLSGTLHFGAIWLEGRYAYGLANVSSVTGISAHFEEMQALVGLRLGGRR